jgi:hypothetical protein
MNDTTSTGAAKYRDEIAKAIHDSGCNVSTYADGEPEACAWQEGGDGYVLCGDMTLFTPMADAVLQILDRALTEQREAIADALQEKSDATKAEAKKTPSLGYLFGFADCYYQAAEIARNQCEGGA